MSAEALRLIRDGMALTEAGRFDDAIGRFDAALAACEGSTDAADRLSVAEAMFQKATAYIKAGQGSQASATFRDLVQRFGSMPDTMLAQQVCRARINEGAVAGSAGQTDDALTAFDDAIRRADAAAEPWSAEVTADALYNKATVLRQGSRSDEAVVTFDELIARFIDSADENVRRRLCMAMYNKAVELQKARKMAPAAAAFAATVEQFQRAHAPDIRERVAWSLLCQSSCLEALGDTPAARGLLDKFLITFRTATEPAIVQEVDKLLVKRLKWIAASAPRPAMRGDADSPAMMARIGGEASQIYEHVIAQSASGDPLAAIGFFISFSNKYQPREQAPLLLDHLISRLQRQPELHLWTALSFYYKGATQLTAGNYNNVAIAYLAEFASRYLLDTDPEIRYFVAMALANTARGLIALDRRSEVSDVFPAFGIKFYADNDPRIQAVVRNLLSRGSGYLDFAAPTDHPDAMLLGELARLDEQEMLEPELREITQRDRQHVLGMLDHATRAAHERHDKALAIVEAYRRTGEPFGLFLRSFAIEAQQTLLEDGAQAPTPLIALNIEEPRVEWRLKAGLRDRIPVIGVANPVDAMGPVGPHAKEDFPKLSLPHDYWRAALLELIDCAAFVVVNVTDGSDGVIYELNTLLAMGRDHLTLVVAAEPEARPPQVSSFAHIVDASAIEEDAWDSLPALANLLKRAMYARSLPPEVRRHQPSVDERFAAQGSGGINRR